MSGSGEDSSSDLQALDTATSAATSSEPRASTSTATSGVGGGNVARGLIANRYIENTIIIAK